MTDTQLEGPALFRIERKQLIEQRKVEKKKLSALQEVHTSELVIGTLSSSGLVLGDPIVSDRHCAFVFQGGEFHVKDLENASGTFHNGVRVIDLTPLADGDRVALGVTLLELQWNAEEPAILGVRVREGAFFHTLKKRGEFASDTDEWVRSEVKFGQMPKLRALNALAVVLLLAVVAWMTFLPGGHEALQPGHLTTAHARLFSVSPPVLSDSHPGAAHLATMVALAQEERCGACHDPFGVPSSEKCAVCHGDLVAAAVAQQAHPFEAGDSLECADCHREHHGAEPPQGTLSPANFTTRCADCHGSDLVDEASLAAGLLRAEQDYALSPTTDDVIARRTSAGFEAFNHRSHSKISDCAVCHEPGSNSDFVEVTFETCDRCHGVNATVAGAHLPPPEMRWSVNWHGAGADEAHCRKCHSAPYTNELKSLERRDLVSLVFNVGARSHGDVFHSTERQEDCTRCHVSGKVIEPGRTLMGRPFRHDLHLSALVPGPLASRELLNGQCAECHTDTSASPGLTTAFSGPPLDSCTVCHRDDRGAALITEAGEPMTRAPTSMTREFPHDLHTGVEDGCLACHEFGSRSEPSLGFPMASTPEDVATCIRCHMGRQDGLNLAHTNIGGGQCAGCHAPGTSSAGGLLATVFYGEPRQGARASSFSHSLEAHQGPSCVECHGDPAEQDDVHSPPESAPSCRACHAASRFHWR